MKLITVLLACLLLGGCGLINVEHHSSAPPNPTMVISSTAGGFVRIIADFRDERGLGWMVLRAEPEPGHVTWSWEGAGIKDETPTEFKSVRVEWGNNDVFVTFLPTSNG